MGENKWFQIAYSKGHFKEYYFEFPYQIWPSLPLNVDLLDYHKINREKYLFLIVLASNQWHDEKSC